MRHFFAYALITWLVSCQDKQEVYTIQYNSITQSVYASGFIKTEGQYQVYPKSNGIIRKIFVEEGSQVAIGAPLMSLDNKVLDYNEELSNVNAKFNDRNNNQDKLDELNQTIQISAKKLKVDSLLFVRQRNLWDQGIGSKLDYEQKDLIYENSKSNYQSLKIRHHQLLKQLRYLDNQAAISNKISNIQSGDLLVKSQLNGKVYQLLKEEGEMVSPQTPVAIIGSKDSFVIELNIDETDITKILVGQQVFLSLESYENQSFDGRVFKIYPIMNERTKTFTVLAYFIQKPKILYPNLSLEANILIQKRDKALLIPVGYLTSQNEVKLKSGEIRKVKIGLKNFEMVEILDGLKVNDIIIKPS